MFSQVNVDSCKTPGCKNLGVLNSPDYQNRGKCVMQGMWFSFSCDFGKIAESFSPVGKSGMERVDKILPRMRRRLTKKYGFSAQGEPRVCCQQCHKTFLYPVRYKTDPRRIILPHSSGKGLRWRISDPPLR